MTTAETSNGSPEEQNEAVTDYNSNRRFVDFPLSQEVVEGILAYGFEVATPVQAASIELAVAGRDLVVRAKTGTGKTAAFGIPAIERIDVDSPTVQGLVLAPTRELAQQIAQQCADIGSRKGIKEALLVGGLPINAQIKALEQGAQLAVGTPGRILDLLRKKHLVLDNLKVVCLDEADEMLSLGFLEDVTTILKMCPDERQILLFSATVSEATSRIVSSFLRDPENIYLSSDTDNVENISHVIYETPPKTHKARSLLYLLDMEAPTNAIIFCNTREDAATVASFLDRQGLDAHLLSGELPQSQRSHVMKRIKSGEVKFLVATDVASRGIDISGLSHVINYSLPKDAKLYLHRAGRTGRLGKTGTSINLIGGTDLATRRVLETQHNLVFEDRPFPTAEECVRRRVEQQAEQIKRAMGSMVFEAYLPTVDGLLEMEGGKALLAASLRAFFQWDRQRRAELTGMVGGRPTGAKSSSRPVKGKRGRDSDRSGKGRQDRDRKNRKNRNVDSDDILLEGSSNKPASDKNKRKRRRRNKKPKSNESKSRALESNDLDSLLSMD